MKLLFRVNKTVSGEGLHVVSGTECSLKALLTERVDLNRNLQKSTTADSRSNIFAYIHQIFNNDKEGQSVSFGVREGVA